MAMRLLVAIFAMISVVHSLDLPVITPFSFPSSSRAGNRTTVVCIVTSGSNPLEFSWLKDRQPITASNIDISNAKSHSALHFEEIKSDDGGEYKCIVKNPAGTASHSAILVIEGELFKNILSLIISLHQNLHPLLTNSTTSTERKENKSEWNAMRRDSLHPKSSGKELEVGSHYFILMIVSLVVFKTDNDRIIHGNVLLIQSLSKESSGDWECIASNGLQPEANKRISIRLRGTFSFS